MRRKNERHTDGADRVVKDIRRQTRKRYSSEDKIRIVLAGLRGEDSIVDLSRFNAAPSSHLSSYLFESQWAFPT
jgi:transposase